MKKLFLIFLFLPIFLNAQIKRAFLFEQNGQNIIPTTISNLLPFSNQLGNLGSNSIRWNFGYLDTIITNHLSISTWNLNSIPVITTGVQLNYINTATGTTGTPNSNIVFSNNPTLTAPNIVYAYTMQSLNYTVTSSDYAIYCTGGAGGITITLPPAAGNSGRVFVIKKIDSGAGKITIDGNLNETIDGLLTWILTLQFESVTIQSNGSNWYIN